MFNYTYCFYIRLHFKQISCDCFPVQFSIVSTLNFKVHIQFYFNFLQPWVHVICWLETEKLGKGN